MANYDEPLPTTDTPEPVVSRLRYFDTQLLQDQDFIDDQLFNLVQRHSHNRLLHVAGIACGLDLAPVGSPATSFTVSAGSAFDANGRQIVLAPSRTVPLPAGTAAGNLYIYVEFHEDPTDPSPPDDSRRFTGKPNVLVGPNPVPADAVLLGVVNVDASGKIASIDKSERVYSGVNLPGPTGSAGAILRASGDGAPGGADLVGNLRVPSPGTLAVGGSVGIGVAAPAQYKLQVGGGDVLLGDSATQNNPTRSVLLAGNVYLIPNGLGQTSYLQARRGDDSGTTQLQLQTWHAGSPVNALLLDDFGNAQVSGTLASGGDLNVGGGKFSVTAQSGNASVAGLLSANGGLGVAGSDEVGLTSSSGGGGRFQVYGGTTTTPLGFRVKLTGGARWQLVDGANNEYFGVSYPDGGVKVAGQLRVNGTAPTGTPGALDTNYPPNGMTLRSPSSLNLTGGKSTALAVNAYFDGNGWNRYDTTTPACYWSMQIDGTTTLVTAQPASNPIAPSASTTRLLLTRTGALGLGTTNTPQSRLHVVGTNNAGASRTDGIYDYGIATFEDGSSPANGVTIGYDTGNDRAWIYSRNSAGPKPLSINNTLFIQSSLPDGVVGFVGIGTTVPQAPLHVTATTTRSFFTGYGWLNGTNPTGKNSGGTGGAPVSIYASGRIITDSEVDAASDERFKEVLDPLEPRLAATLLERLVARRFRWRQSPDRSIKIGFIAQEVDQVIPEAVTRMVADGLVDKHYLNYDALFTLNIAATQYLIQAVKELKERLS